MSRIRMKNGLWVAAAAIALMGCEEAPPLGVDLEEVGFSEAEALTGRSLELTGKKKQLSLDLCNPAVGGFTTASTNPYFPMVVGDQWFYEGDEDGAEVTLLITVLNEVQVIDGVTTRVIEEREWEDGELLEVSWNYYAQAGNGTICYFGEDVDIYEVGGGIVHDGAWCAEDPSNPDHAPGIFMPADPVPGQRYQMEVAPGIAEDRGRIVGGRPKRLDGVLYSETIRVRESNPLDGGSGFKTFASGTGLIIDGPVELEDFRHGAGTPGPPTITQQSCGS